MAYVLPEFEKVNILTSGCGSIPPTCTSSGLENGNLTSVIITSDDDDGWFNYTNSTVTKSATQFGANKGSWLTFKNITIPQNAQINKAILVLTGAGSTGFLVSVDISAHCSHDSWQNPGGYLGSPNDTGIWQRTSTVVSWIDEPAWTYNESIESPDIACVIQEIVNFDLWTSGNAIKIFIDDYGNSTGYKREFFDYSTDSTKAAQLLVWWNYSYTETSSGGFVYGDSNVIVGTGGYLYGSSASITNNYNELSTGGLNLGTSADINNGHAETSTGGIVFNHAPFSNGFRNRIKITIPSGTTTENLTSFIAGFRISTDRYVDSIRCETLSGSYLPSDLREIGTDIAFYVQLDISHSTDTSFYLYY